MSWRVASAILNLKRSPMCWAVDAGERGRQAGARTVRAFDNPAVETSFVAKEVFFFPCSLTGWIIATAITRWPFVM